MWCIEGLSKVVLKVGGGVLKGERCISDHGLIYGTVPGTVKKKQNVRIVRCWSRCDINAVVSDLEASPWSAMESFDDR